MGEDPGLGVLLGVGVGEVFGFEGEIGVVEEGG